MSPLPSHLPVELLDATLRLMGRAGRGATMPVVGVSMRPTLGEGQSIAVRFGSDRPRLGDLLVFRQRDSLVVHRLVGRKRNPGGGRVYLLRGDGKNERDAPVPPERVVGRVVAFGNDAGWYETAPPGARLYAVALAVHGRCWSLAGSIGLRVDRAARRLGLRPRFQYAVTRCDAALLRLCHRTLFRRLHRAVDRLPPTDDDARLGALGVGE